MDGDCFFSTVEHQTLETGGRYALLPLADSGFSITMVVGFHVISQ